jgi:uncharacterized membrane protein
MLTTTNAGTSMTIDAPAAIKNKRLESIDLLRGTVMVIMALDHVRSFFNADAFLYNPTDLTQTSVILFCTRWITHFCAPVFVMLAGTSAYLYGIKRNRQQLSFFLLTRGIWLVFIELFIVTLAVTFNPLYPVFNMQVIWAIGISMIVLSAIVYMNRRLILVTGIMLIAAHNLLDTVHVPGHGIGPFLWSVLHEPRDFTFGYFTFSVRYPVLPWIGIMCVGYSLGSLYTPAHDPVKRKKILLALGSGAIALFILLRSGNWYGDAAQWSVQKNAVFSLLSFLNTTKYPPSLLYIFMTLGPALIFLAFAEVPLNTLTKKIQVYGSVPMFYYLAHFFLIHLLALIAAIMSGYKGSAMILTTRLSNTPALKGYGFSLMTVYLVWIGLVLFLYPLCKWFNQYKRTHQGNRRWLSYL